MSSHLGKKKIFKNSVIFRKKMSSSFVVTSSKVKRSFSQDVQVLFLLRYYVMEFLNTLYKRNELRHLLWRTKTYFLKYFFKKSYKKTPLS